MKFTLTQDGVATCALPAATIAVTRTSGGTTGAIDESVYVMAADNGSNFKIASCQYVYNLSASALGVGTYRADIKINGTVIGNAIFQLKQAFCCCPQTAATCNKPSRFETRGGFSF